MLAFFGGLIVGFCLAWLVIALIIMAHAPLPGE